MTPPPPPSWPCSSPRAHMARRSVLLATLAGMAGLLPPVARGNDPPEEAIFTAVKRNNGSQLRRVLEEQALNVNVIGPDGQTPLTLALQLDSDKALYALLVSQHIDINFSNRRKESPLMIAALTGNLEMVQHLLRRGAAVNTPGWNALHYAASGQTDDQQAIIQLLLVYRTPINARSPNNTTPLMLAASYGSEAVVQLLIASGADTTLQNDQGLTASDFALRANRDRLVSRMQEWAAQRELSARPR